MSVAEEKASLHNLPVLRLSTVSEEPGPGWLPVDHQVQGRRVRYWRKVDTRLAAQWRTFAKLPLVLNSDGSPWAPACLWLLDRAIARPKHLSSLTTPAQGLRDYKVFLDEMGLEWDDFSSVDKYLRPTYLYSAHLEELIKNGDIKRSTASRRMSAVVGFYRFLGKDKRMRFEPANEPWVEKQVSFEYTDSKGFAQVGSVATTDVSIPNPRRDDAWDETIADGGKLRPLPVEEQRALIRALKTLGNREYELMHYASLLSGARVMTVLTLRVSGFIAPPSSISSWPYKLRCGPGTGIDTKRDVSDVYLTIPKALYEMLHVYAVSPRAERRRLRSRLGNDLSNYLFLTSQGKPYYESKEDRNAVRGPDELLRKSSPTGQNLREFMEKVMVEVRKVLPGFKYKFHDLRATFGMNWVDHIAEQDDTKESFTWAREQLRKLMWHKSATTTDLYLEYRQRMRHLEKAQAEWNADLLNIILQA